MSNKVGSPVSVCRGGGGCGCGKNAASKKKKKAPKEKCEHESLTVKCSHDREIKLPVKPPLRPQRVLEVVAGPSKNKDIIKCQTQIKEGPCSRHQKKVFDLDDAPEDAKAAEKKANDSLQFEAHSIPLKWSEPWSFLWPRNVPCRRYSIFLHSCSGSSHQAEVRVYPDIKWEVSFSIKYLKAGSSVERTSQKTLKELEPKARKKLDQGISQKTEGSGWSFSGSAKYTSDGNTTEVVNANFKKRVTQTLHFLDAASKAFKKVAEGLDTAFNCKFDWEYPALDKLAGTWGWQEHPSKPICCYAFQLEFALQLIAASFEVDLTKAILKIVTSGGGTALVEALKRAEKKGSFTAKIAFVAQGKIALAGQWAYEIDNHGSDLPASPLKVELSLEFTIKGEASYKLDVFGFFTASGGAEVGMKSGFTGTAERKVVQCKPMLYMQLDWNGLHLYAKWQSPTMELKKKTSRHRRRIKKKQKPRRLHHIEETSPASLQGEGSYTIEIHPKVPKLWDDTFDVFS